MNILVTGGAGYIGSVVDEELLNDGYSVIVLDNLQQGHREAVPKEASFTLTDIRDNNALDAVFKSYKIDAVMHMAAESLVAYSMTDPARYFRSNVAGGINLLDAMIKHDVTRIIFSSSASVYGEPESVPIYENHPRKAVNAYGESKLMFENILNWYGKAYGLKHISLRYFNAAGAGKRLGEDHRPETHLIPIVLNAALNNGSVDIFGTDYPTRDGSCVRDYVHVTDIARAHILALSKIEKAGISPVCNLGNGEGYSVLEVVETVKKVTGRDIPVRICPRRAGDPAALVAGSDLSRTQLGWKPEFSDLESIIASAWKWIVEHPNGYEK